MARVAAISAGPRSASPRGRRALSFWDFLGFSAILVHTPSAALVSAQARRGNLVTRPAQKFVMAGLDPTVHAFLLCSPRNVDARDKPGHDGENRPTPRRRCLSEAAE